MKSFITIHLTADIPDNDGQSLSDSQHALLGLLIDSLLDANHKFSVSSKSIEEHIIVLKEEQ